jgi:CheY-like chemotaxis protein
MRQQPILKVLMIEDDSEVSSLIKGSLEHQKTIMVQIASDPFQAMNLMSENFYNYIILDWKLPILNGCETIETADRLLRLDPSLPTNWDRYQVPVIILSAAQKSDCFFKDTSHFKFAKHISKQQSLKEIITDLKTVIINEMSLSYKSA